MIDIHSHIVPGVDDGAQTFEQSVAMLELAIRTGTTDIVATPHASPEFDFQPEVTQAEVARLRAHFGERIRVHTGCDMHLSFDNVEDARANPAKYSINGRGYLLVEFSDLVIFKNSTEALEGLMAVGLTPIVTHPERNPLLRQRMGLLREWVGRGILMQLTADVPFGKWGSSAQRFAEEMLDEGLVHFVASDGHDEEKRQPRLDEVYAWVEENYGAARARRLMITNPGAVLKGDPLPAVEEGEPRVSRRRPWYAFWRRR